jgi:hypothetical protein
MFFMQRPILRPTSVNWCGVCLTENVNLVFFLCHFKVDLSLQRFYFFFYELFIVICSIFVVGYLYSLNKNYKK